ncbi:hypothetical protein [Parasegetibacter sp. NRK P23]|uniref:hypothetical protein n=1 Tax=Parasegetibacter sp. NRK P23 TaxID=2942999 RepID=UPI002043214E|nr:hypothetical protein [Parasegetibacter sp. NRK P23]MCM5530635.1 hypothetical protein [Parasegetibacter sp. NRK P23]
MDILTLSQATRKIGANQTPRDYWDFMVSGKSLKTILNLESADYMTLINLEGNQEYYRHVLNVFTLKEKSQLASGRVMIYVCPECGDIECGAITATIKDFEGKIVLGDFGYETGYAGLTEIYDQIEPIEFERASYFAAFSRLSIL